MEETISLKEIFQTLKQRWKILILIPLLAMLVSALATTFFITPMYERESQLLVNQTVGNGELRQADVRTNIELIDTYSDIITSPIILNQVIEEEGLDQTVNELKNMISIGSQNNSQVVLVTVESPSPEEATVLVNRIANVFQQQIPEIYSVEDNVTILSEAEVGESPSPVSPNLILNIAIAFVVGLMAAVGLSFLLEYLDTTIKNEKDIEKVVGLPVLGAISNMDNIDSSKKTS
ncbi:YveK family protein [Shouchella patagoniensis]|uniref:YveK family protein n=1 Tax=Shouchella patagoniensis TaxID=228576 RepID=UPI0009952C03|nr:Wzz/FepE/Etk N-terminal domain-containing protein [Shouchella patagoniensis]